MEIPYFLYLPKLEQALDLRIKPFLEKFVSSITATPRHLKGTSACRRLRREGKVPGIVYGAGAQNEEILLEHNPLRLSLNNEQFHSSILDLLIEGEDGKQTQQKVLLRKVQYHPYLPLILHIDFQRIDESKPIHTRVPLHYLNQEICPAIKAKALITHVMNELEISCLPAHLPPFIEVDLAELKAGQTLHAKDATLPEGVALVGQDNPVILSAVAPSTETEESTGTEPTA